MSNEDEAPLPRLRRSTIDLFNDEMAVLDRPLDNDVEYIDDKPPAKRRWFGTIAGAALVLGGAAFLFWARTSGQTAATPALAIATAAPAPAPAPIIAPIPSPIPAAAVAAAAVPVEAAPPTPAPLAPAPVVLAQAEEAPAAMPRVSSRATWAKAAKSTRHPAPKHRRGRR